MNDFLKKHQQKIVGLLSYLMVALLILFVWYVALSRYANDLMVKSTALLIVYAIYIIWWLTATRSVKSIFFYFFCYCALTNAGQLLLYAFDLEIVGIINAFLWSTDAYIIKSIDFQMLCTVFMCTFALAAHLIHTPKTPKVEELDTLGITERSKYISWPEMIFIVSGILYVFINITRLGSRADSTYLDAFNEGSAQSTPFILMMSFYVSLYMSCTIHPDKTDKFRKIILLIGCLVGVTNLLFGSRNVLIPLVFGLIFLWGDKLKEISGAKKAGIFALALIFLYLIGSFVNLRRMALSQITPSVLVDALFGAGLYDQLVLLVSEMGSSLRVLTVTMSFVDTGAVESEQTFLYTFLKGVVPKVSILEFLGISEPERWRLSAWITDTHGSNAGWGYSMFAEAYYNFKELGFLFMGAFGYFFAWLECQIDKWYKKGQTIMASGWLFFATYVIFLARADSILITTRIRYALYLAIICMILRNRVKLPKLKIDL